MDRDEPEPFSYTAKRLVDPRDLAAILKHNLDNLDAWRGRYPNHARWIRAAIKGISEDDYTRLAFGVFMHDGDHTGKLVCSAIVKKDRFGPYIEIKNVLLLNLPRHIGEDRLRTHKQHCYRKIIHHIQRFAESRGYTKLVTELVNRNNDDRDLIQAFLRCKFDVSGSHLRRFMPTDETIILSYDIHPVYGLDPYDFDSAAKWLINRHIPEFQIKEHGEASRAIEIRVNDNEKLMTKNCIELSSHRKGLESLKKFSTSCDVLVIESYLAANNQLSVEDQLDVQFGFDPSGRVYIFDFTPKRNGRPTLWQRELLPKIQERHRDSAYFDRDELNDLLYHPSSTEPPLGPESNVGFRVTADLPLEDVGGLLTLTDPTRLDGENIVSNRLAGKNSVYIKLGPKGKYAQAGQILIFYFPSSDSSSDASVWGYAEIDEVQPFDIQAARDIHARNLETGFGKASEQRSDADVVFDHLQQLEEDFEVAEAAPLWKREEFERHNTYNATNEVVLFYLSHFVDLRSRMLPLDQLVIGDAEQSEFRRDSIVKEIDAYISTQEAQRIRAYAGETRPEWKAALPSTPYNVLCIWSSPDDQGRLSYEVSTVKNTVAGRREYVFLDPAINVNFLGLKDTLRTSAPHLIHIGGHGTPAGLEFSGVDGSWTLDAATLNDALSSCGSRPFLIVLNCCYSDSIAQAVSKQRFAIGFEGELDDKHGQAFTGYYLTGLMKGFSAETIESQLIDIAQGFVRETKGRARPHVWRDCERLNS